MAIFCALRAHFLLFCPPKIFLAPPFSPQKFDAGATTGPWMTSAWPSTPPMHYHSGQGFFPPKMVAIGYSWTIWPLVDPRWPLHDLPPQQCITLRSGVLPTKFGSHRTFLRQIDLWMTFDLWSGRFEKLTTNLGGPYPTTLPSFSSMRRSTTKRIAGQTNKLGFFISIDR